MKKKENVVRLSPEMNKIKAEFELATKKLGKSNSKTQYLEQLLNFQNSVENIEKNMNKADLKGLSLNFTKGMSRALEVKNIAKKYDEYNGALNNIATQIFEPNWTDKDIIASTTLFLYLIDCGYSRNNHFVDSTEECYLQSLSSSATGEMMAYSAIDTEGGKFRFYKKLLDKGFTYTPALEYPEMIDLGGQYAIQIVTVGEPKIIPYHLFQNNYKNFEKSLTLEENQIANSEFLDFTDSLEKVGEKVADAVMNFWGIHKFMSLHGLGAFLNTTTLEALHALYSKYLCKEFSDSKTPIIKINERYISARKLLECILIKNKVNYTLNQDLLYRDQYYLKIEFDADTMVKYMPYSIQNEKYELNDIETYVSANAFNGKDKSANDKSNSPAQSLNDKLDDAFVPSSAEEVMMQFMERQNKKNGNASVLLDLDVVDEKEFENTASVDMTKAKQEEAELKRDGVQFDLSDLSNLKDTQAEKQKNDENKSVFDEYKLGELDDTLINFDEDELFNKKSSDNFSNQMAGFLGSSQKNDKSQNPFDDIEITLDDLKIASPKESEDEIKNANDFDLFGASSQNESHKEKQTQEVEILAKELLSIDNENTIKSDDSISKNESIEDYSQNESFASNKVLNDKLESEPKINELAQVSPIILATTAKNLAQEKENESQTHLVDEKPNKQEAIKKENAFNSNDFENQVMLDTLKDIEQKMGQMAEMMSGDKKSEQTPKYEQPINQDWGAYQNNQYSNFYQTPQNFQGYNANIYANLETLQNINAPIYPDYQNLPQDVINSNNSFAREQNNYAQPMASQFIVDNKLDKFEQEENEQNIAKLLQPEIAGEEKVVISKPSTEVKTQSNSNIKKPNKPQIPLRKSQVVQNAKPTLPKPTIPPRKKRN